MAGAAPCNRREAPLVVCIGGRAGKTQILQLQMGAKRQALEGKHILSPPEHPRPLRFRHEWSQTVASTHPTAHTPHTHTHTHTLGCKHHTITMPSASWQRGNPLWQRITLISSSAAQSQSYQRCGDAAPAPGSPPGLPARLSSIPLLVSSPHSSLAPLLLPLLLFFSTPPVHHRQPASSFPPLYLSRLSPFPSNGYWWCD